MNNQEILDGAPKNAELRESNSHAALRVKVQKLSHENAELRKERDELNKQCGELQEGFFEYMGWCDHLQIEVDNLKKKIVNLTTPDTSEKLGVDS